MKHKTSQFSLASLMLVSVIASLVLFLLNIISGQTGVLFVSGCVFVLLIHAFFIRFILARASRFLDNAVQKKIQSELKKAKANEEAEDYEAEDYEVEDYDDEENI